MPHKFGGLAIGGDRAHRLADACVVQQQIQQPRDHHRQHRCRDMRAGEGVAAPAHARHVDRHIVRAGGPPGGAEPDQHHVEGEGGEQAHQFRAPDHPVHADPVQRDADDETEDDHHRHGAVGRQPERARQHIQHEHADDDDRAMGEIDDIHDAPNERQAHGGKPIDRADEDAVNHGGEDADHAEFRTAAAAVTAAAVVGSINRGRRRSWPPSARSLP